MASRNPNFFCLGLPSGGATSLATTHSLGRPLDLPGVCSRSQHHQDLAPPLDAELLDSRALEISAALQSPLQREGIRVGPLSPASMDIQYKYEVNEASVTLPF